MPTVVNTDTQAASSRTASITRSVRRRRAFERAYSASFAAPVIDGEDTARVVVVEVTAILGSPAFAAARQRDAARERPGPPVRSAADQSFASRAWSFSMVMPTSLVPPNTVPFLPF